MKNFGTVTIANNAPSIFGFGAIGQLSSALQDLGISRPLVCTDVGIINSGLLDQVLEHLATVPAVYSDTPPNPNEAAVMAATKHYKAENCDGVIALGGGS